MIGPEPFDRTLVPPGLLACDLEDLADRFGTPLFVYDEDHLRARCRAYREHFGEGNVAYASKAFLCTAMARLVHEEGLNLDVSTGGELAVALYAGFPPSRIVMHGNNKSDGEITAALGAGVGTVVVDSHDELDRLDRAVAVGGARPRVLVRVTPGVEAHTHEFVETGTERSKFGFSISTGAALDAVRRVASSHLAVSGLHCHIGSQIYRLDSYRRATEIVVRFAEETERVLGVTIGELDLGGGLGARYLSDDPEVALAEYAAALRDAAGDRRVTVEPGRSIAGPAAVTLYRVGTVKHVEGAGTYVAVDGGMSDNPRPVLYGAGYEAFLPRRVDDPRPVHATVVGKHCEQGDVVVAGARLPEGVRAGDLLATPTTGAYGYSMASNYNRVPRPAVVFVRGGEAREVVRRETFDDLIRLDRA